MSNRPTPELKLPDVTCHPSCIRCSHPEGRGHCKICVIVCDHSRQPHKRRPVELCITRIRAPVRLSIGRDGQALLTVDPCPHCHHTHIHSAELDINPWRRAGCGQPYLLET